MRCNIIHKTDTILVTRIDQCLRNTGRICSTLTVPNQFYRFVIRQFNFPGKYLLNKFTSGLKSHVIAF